MFNAFLQLLYPKLCFACEDPLFESEDFIVSMDERLTLEEIRDLLRLRALKSDLGQAVLRDFDGAASSAHLRTKIVHLRNRDTSIVGHDN